MQDILDFLADLAKKLYLPITVAILGTVVHLYRSKEELSIGRFSILTIINVGMVFTTGIICQDYLEMKNERMIWVLSGIACSFSTYILDFIQLAITDIAPEVARKVFGLEKKDEDNA